MDKHTNILIASIISLKKLILDPFFSIGFPIPYRNLAPWAGSQAKGGLLQSVLNSANPTLEAGLRFSRNPYFPKISINSFLAASVSFSVMDFQSMGMILIFENGGVNSKALGGIGTSSRPVK